MYELKQIGKVFTIKFVGIGPSSYKKRIYRAAVLQRLRNTVLDDSVGSRNQNRILRACSVVPILTPVLLTYSL